MLLSSTNTRSEAVKMLCERFVSKFVATVTSSMLRMKNCLSSLPLPANSLMVELTGCGASYLLSLALKPVNRLMKWVFARVLFLQSESITCLKLLQSFVNTMQEMMLFQNNFDCVSTLRQRQTTQQSVEQRRSQQTFKLRLMKFSKPLNRLEKIWSSSAV